MIRKRSLIRDICDNKRRRLHCNDNGPNDSVPTDTRSSLSYLASIFPTEKFTNRLPPIIMRHLIYAFVKSRTEVDRDLNDLRRRGEVRLFKMGEKDDQIAVVYTKDYKEYVERSTRNNPRVERFLKNVVAVCPEISFSDTVLNEDYGFREEDIIELIRQGVLTCRDVGCYWLSIPRAGEFMKAFVYGRRAMLQHVRRTKYKEILQSELELRKLPKKALLGILYHVYDIIGTESVCRLQTTSGPVLRLRSELGR